MKRHFIISITICMGKRFLGSYKGMRFRLARNPLENVFFKPKRRTGSRNINCDDMAGTVQL